MSGELLWVHCGDCGHDFALGRVPMTAEMFGALGRTPCPECKSATVYMGQRPKTTPKNDPHAWLESNDTGMSSDTIWRVLMGETPQHPRIPWDPSDFGRCYRLLKLMPEWRERLPEVAVRYPMWVPLVAAWDELTSLYEEELKNVSGMAPRLYERMKQLRTKDAR